MSELNGLNMHIREVGYDGFLLIESLSFETAVTPSSSGLITVIKVIINEVNSVACTVEAL